MSLFYRITVTLQQPDIWGLTQGIQASALPRANARTLLVAMNRSFDFAFCCCFVQASALSAECFVGLFYIRRHGGDEPFARILHFVVSQMS